MRVRIRTSSPRRSAELTRMLSSEPDIIVVPESFADDGVWSQDGAGDDILIREPGPREDLSHAIPDEQNGDAKTVLLVTGATEEFVSNAVRSGARGVLSADINPDVLIAALRAVNAGLIVLSEDDLPHFSRERFSTTVERLTPRELEVLTSMAEGLTNKEIASRLGISDNTVKFHVATILSKLGASSRTEAVTIGIKSGVVAI